MPTNNINVGQDFTFSFYEFNTGKVIEFGDIQSFKEDDIKHDVASHPYNGLPRFAYVPAGHKGSFTIKRTGHALDDLQIQLKDLFYSGRVVGAGFINKTTRNTDGSITRYQYTGAVFWMNQRSSGSREKEIDQEVEWMASDIKRIA